MNNEIPDNDTQNDSPKDTKKKIMAVAIQTMIIVILIAGGLWLVCRKSWQRNTGENATEDITENTEATVASTEELSADTEEGEPEVTVISILGKEELVIENSRIYDDKSDLGYLDNRFTLEEIDAILNVIEGTWIVDEYVGFVPYEAGTWSEGEGTEEEKQEQYEKTVEQAERNLPEFFFQIKIHNDERFVDSGQYIYVHSDNQSYASPISVALSMQRRGEQYSEFARRTTRGAGIPSGFAYPVIYIEFFVISCSEEGAVSYEPATLILASDGSFLLLKDGAFYSVRKDSIQNEIMSGNFEHLVGEFTDGVTYSEYMTECYPRFKEDHEWRQLDLNGDGIDDLIWQYTGGGYGETQSIVGIFACDKDGARCIRWDTADMTEYYFCGPTGELMYMAPYYGLWNDCEPYKHCYYDREWNLIRDYDLVVFRIDLEEGMEEYPQHVEEWRENHPDMAESGVYFRKITDAGEEAMTKEEFTEAWESVTGLKLYSSFFH